VINVGRTGGTFTRLGEIDRSRLGKQSNPPRSFVHLEMFNELEIILYISDKKKIAFKRISIILTSGV
jgi:hypothetical protein